MNTQDARVASRIFDLQVEAAGVAVVSARSRLMKLSVFVEGKPQRTYSRRLK